MCIIELNGVFLREFIPVIMFHFELVNKISDSSSTEEILLFQSKFFSFFSGVIGIQNTGQVFSSLPADNCSEIISLIKRLEIKFIARFRFPKSQTIAVKRVISWNWDIVGLSYHSLASFPLRPLNATLLVLFCVPIKFNGISYILTWDLPRIASSQPIIRYFYLVPI